ncbi:hypothetical protein Acid345_0816 [Candidatus Koribacter versatilis Ellin345]|uniref:Uncharacterized protein n=1 Tax=Koribacter versatilis (strain Ellin345) TaxID=204669 RepID=Q1ITH9_KORVE|nr:hypothetical protein [Candidatus Koribacter versatilis]ABF39821.1 hypothetical protein Acid345_0816 [Candidatus Koribacter versatilis Ellin345]
MSDDSRDVLEVLRYELNFLEQGGYRAQKNPLVPISPFQDSLSCINYGLPRRPNPCRNCLLWDFVPDQYRREDAPCHFIPLTPSGLTIETRQSEAELEANLKAWLRDTIAKLEQERANGKV